MKHNPILIGLFLINECMSPIGLLDEAKATLRLLLLLYEDDAINLTVLRKRMIDKYSVGRTIVNSSREALFKLKLIEEKKGKIGPNPAILTHLTSKGRLIAKRLNEIIELLE